MGRALAQYFPVRFRPSGWGGLPIFFGCLDRLTLTLVSCHPCIQSLFGLHLHSGDLNMTIINDDMLARCLL
jgi:hypothetical protein